MALTDIVHQIAIRRQERFRGKPLLTYSASIKGSIYLNITDKSI